MYHAANITDLDEAIDYIMHVRPSGIKLGVGVSLGAAVLANVRNTHVNSLFSI